MKSIVWRAVATAVLAGSIAGCGLTSHPPVSKDPTTPPMKKPSKISAAIPWHASKPSKVLPGDVLIADAGNNRILLVTPQKKIVWQYPSPGQPSLLHDNDDVFFGPHFDEIITNQEGYNVVSILNFNSKKIVWNYGHGGIPGSAPGYLNTPDDAFLYHTAHGDVITVADIQNQRILFLSRKTHKIIKQYGQTGVMSTNPPYTYSAPNGDFPAPNGGMLVTQINGNDAVLLNRNNQVQYTVHFPSKFYYPSDANFTPHGNIIVAFYTKPGAIVEMSPKGKILWSYFVTSGPGMLNQPSLAVRLSNGMVLLNDDHNDRVIVINPKTDKIVWQYGHTHVAGTAPGYLKEPDGLDLLPAGIVPGGHNSTGHHLWSYPGNGL